MDRGHNYIWRFGVAASFLSMAVGLGCISARRAVPFVPPLSVPLAPVDEPPAGHANPSGYGTSVADAAPMRRPRHVLAMSSGGVYGAFTSGVLAGWSANGTRPEFDVITGVSTGALISPFAFLGPSYDAAATRLYVGVRTEDIFRYRAWVTLPWKDAVANASPLRKLIRTQITPAFVAAIAAEHRRGRRLYVGTTNLDTRRFVVWDVGAIACGDGPKACDLVCDVLLASSSVPGVFPPVPIEVEVDGKKYLELHCDGGASATIFVPSVAFAAASSNGGAAAGGIEPSPVLYAVVAGKLFPEARPVRLRVLPVLGASATALLYANTRADLSNLYTLSRAAGFDFRMTALRQDFRTADDSLCFEEREQAKLLAEGTRVGLAGPSWTAGPPELMPGDGDYVRTGVRLRSAPPSPCVPGN